MTDPVDTSAEAVAVLLLELDLADQPLASNAAATLRALLARAERAEAVLLAVADATATEGVDVGVLLARIGVVTQSFRDAALLNITNMTDEDMRALFLAAPHVPVDAEINALVADNARLLDSVTAEHEARVKAEAERDALREALRGFLDWADRKCPCHNDLPDPCPLCGASVEGLERCKAADETLPRALLAQARAALSGSNGNG